MERRRDSLEEYSRRLPPPKAWKYPEKYIDLSTGLARPYISKLVLPTDDREFIKIDEAINLVLEYYFWPDYDWPHERDDPETDLDLHHFYHRASAYAPENFEGDMVPAKFREIPTLIGQFPRQFHNVLHDFTAEPTMPDRDAMAEYYQSYQLAVRAFSRLVNSAKGVSTASQMFALRSSTLQSPTLKPGAEEDELAQEFMRELFDRHFTEYGRAKEEIASLIKADFPIPLPEGLLAKKPQLVAKNKIGSFAARSYATLPGLVAA